MTIKVPITQKMGEAIMWSLAEIGDRPRRKATDPSDPLFVLLSKYDRSDIMRAVKGMWDMAYGDWISEPLTDLQKAILRVSVENSSWLTSYHQSPQISNNRTMIREAEGTLRELAVRLEAFGIEVNFMPSD